MAAYFAGNGNSAGQEFKNSTTLYTPAVLNYYEDAAITLNWTGAVPNTNVSARIVRLGNLVTLHCISALSALSTSAAALTGNTAIPTRFAPTNTTSDLIMPITVNNNSAFVPGTLDFSIVNNQLTIYNGAYGGTFSNGVIVGFPSFSISWTFA